MSSRPRRHRQRQIDRHDAAQRRRTAEGQARAGRSTPPPEPDGDPPARLERELVHGAILEAIHAIALHLPPDRGVAALSGPMAERDRRLVASCFDERSIDVTGSLVANGWSPVDLLQLAGRHLPAAGIAYVRDAVAAVTARHSAARVDPAWRDQLARIDAALWWRTDESHFAQWAARHGFDRPAAIATALVALGTLATAYPLPPTMPPPGQAAQPGPAGRAAPGGRAAPAGRADPAGAGGPADRRRIDERMLARVRALLAKAESSEFAAEAETLSAKAQELIGRYALREALASFEAGTQQSAAVGRLWLDPPYVDAKSLLVGVVADANRCRAVLCNRDGCLTLVGDRLDLDVVELLVTSLLVQATHAMVRSGPRTTSYGTSRTRSFRHSFLVSYAHRIGERLSDASRAAADDDRLLPVLATRDRLVEETTTRLFPRLVSKSVRVGDSEGWHAGRAAASLADLGGPRRLSAEEVVA